MSPNQIVRAWKDSDYRAGLTSESSAVVPAHPVGDIDIADSMLDLSGGYEEARTEYLETLGCCQGFTQAGKCDFTGGGGGFFCTAFCFTLIWTDSDWCPAI
jgi:mersacidin/lichenicidin family type 2 lantibiotic